MEAMKIEISEPKSLDYMIHYYTDEKYLFKTIMMYSKDDLNKVSDNIVKNNNWCWHRYRDSDRIDYYKRRCFVENIMKIEFEEKYYKLSEEIPVYFYIIPGINKEKVINNCNSRTEFNENNTKALLIDIKNILNSRNVTFTINDSFRCYLRKAKEAGIDCSKSNNNLIIFEDHNKIFPIIDLIKINEKYKNFEINYEVQVWDKELLEKIKSNKNNYVN
jgi:hypothetical protein